MDQSIVQREIVVQDLTQIAIVHQAAFPDSALTGLGRQTIQRYYYWLLSGSHPLIIARGVEVDGKIAGFIFAGKFQGATTGFVLRNKFFLAFSVFFHIGLLRKPIFRRRLRTGLRLLRYRLLKKPLPRAEISGHPESLKFMHIPYCSVLAIAVDPNQQREGLGWSLMKYVERIAHEKHYLQMRLTVFEHNKSAIQFYQKHGYQVFYQDGEYLVLGKNLVH
ncbi:MAG: GNAT family N-acetyltransferase [Chloroflexi bacterium]|nr:GNAT family N-acetyltransferase [Chloroflexota bacterium]